MKLSSGTGTEDKIELTHFENLGDEGYKCQLILISGPFTANLEFWFDISSAKEVIKCLENIYGKPRTEARLSFRLEEPYIQFKGDGLGHVMVSGLLTYGPPFHRLEFIFQSDQTLVPPFVDSLKSLIQPLA